MSWVTITAFAMACPGVAIRCPDVAGARYTRRYGVPGALDVVPGAGHFVYEDAPQECAAAIVGFLDRTFPR